MVSEPAQENARSLAAAAGMRRRRALLTPRAALALAVCALLALRVWVALTLRVNSDEPQHLHTVWCWTQGLLPYRDVFDNHAPLFHLLYAPLLAALGERADIVPIMRLAVIPWYALAVWLTYRLGGVLYDRRVGIVGAAIVALNPTFFARSAEFRPDDAWACAWLAAVLVAVSGPPTSRRAFACGAFAGLALAFSIKTAVLVAAAVVAAGLVLAIVALQRVRVHWMHAIRVATATIAGGLVLPVAIAAAFAAAGAWDAMRYCLFEHNAVQGLGRWSHAGWHLWIFPALVPLLALALWSALRRQRGEPHAPLRAWLLATALMYLALRASYQPLLARQDLLPVLPMLATVAAALILETGRTKREAVVRIGVAAVLVLEAAWTLANTEPWRDDARRFGAELQALLRLSAPGEPVMDDKGESIFRRRPLYWIMENVTLFRLTQGSIADDVPERLVADRIAVGVFDRERGADREFVRANYLAVAPHVEVAGKRLGAVRAAERVEFDVAVPNRYAIISSEGRAEGLLDGSPYSSPRELGIGRHEFVAGRSAVWILESARAAALGYLPFEAR